MNIKTDIKVSNKLYLLGKYLPCIPHAMRLNIWNSVIILGLIILFYLTEIPIKIFQDSNESVLNVIGFLSLPICFIYYQLSKKKHKKQKELQLQFTILCMGALQNILIANQILLEYPPLHLAVGYSIVIAVYLTFATVKIWLEQYRCKRG